MGWPRTSRRIVGAAAGMLLLIISAALLLSEGETAANSRPVAEVGGDFVTEEELAYFAGLNRAHVVDYFMKKYGAEYGEGFWHKSYAGETPMDTIRQRALADAARMKVELKLARDEGLITGTSLEDIEKEMERENMRRRKAMKNGEPIYGPVAFTMSTFVDFYRSKMLTELKQKLSRSVLSATEEQLKAYYESVKAELFRTEGRIRYDRITVAYRQDGVESSRGKELARSAAERVQQRLEQGQSPDDAVKEARDGALIQLSGREELNDSTASRIFKSMPQLYSALRELTEAKPVTPVIEDRLTGQYVLAHMTEREPGSFKSYEEMLPLVRKHYTESAFEEYVRGRVQEAQVIVSSDLDRVEDLLK